VSEPPVGAGGRFLPMNTIDHPYAIAFIFLLGFIIWIGIKINEDDEPET
jgi:hypothetical protein